MTRTITLRDVLEFGARCSGRTTEIISDCLKFLNQPKKDKCVVIIFCNNYKIVDHYFNEFHYKLNENNENNLKIYRAGNFIINHENERCVFFLVKDDNLDKIRGLKIRDVYFDTPEKDLFNNYLLLQLFPFLTDD